MTETYFFGDIFNTSTSKEFDIHDLNKINNIRRNKYNFSDLSDKEYHCSIIRCFSRRALNCAIKK